MSEHRDYREIIDELMGLQGDERVRRIEGLDMTTRQGIASALRGGAQPQPERPWYQDILQPVGRAFQWAQEEVVEPAAAYLTAPWSPGTERTEGMGWFERQRKEYEDWEAPQVELPWNMPFTDRPMTLGVKGLAEETVWALPTILTLGKAKVLTAPMRLLGAPARAVDAVAEAGRIGAAIDRAMTYPITKPIEVAVKQVTKAFPRHTIRLSRGGKPEEILDSLRARHPDRLRSKIPELQSIQEAVHVKATMEVEGENLVTGLVANLTSIGDASTLFSIADDSIIRNPVIRPRRTGLSMAWGDVFQAPDNYVWGGPEGELLRHYRNVYVALEQGLKQLSDDYGIKVRTLFTPDGEDHISRFVIGVTIDGKYIERLPGMARLMGSKITAEKRRKYDLMIHGAAEHMKEGSRVRYHYALPEQVIEFRGKQIYNRGAGIKAKEIVEPVLLTTAEARMDQGIRQRMAELLERLGTKRAQVIVLGRDVTADVVKPVVLGKAGARPRVGLTGTQEVIKRMLRGETPHPSTLAAIERQFPDVGAALKRMDDPLVLPPTIPTRTAIWDIERVMPYTTTPTKMRSHPSYSLAKGGDVIAARDTVRDIVKPEMMAEVKRTITTDDIIIPIISHEELGHNKLPLAFADQIARATGATVDTDIVQTVRAFHTGKTAIERISARPQFAGRVITGKSYVLVDDYITLGGTISELSNYIKQRGGRVKSVVTITTAGRGSDKLRPSPELLKNLERRFGHVIEEELGVRIGALTHSEATYLNKFLSIERLRDSIAKARGQARPRITGQDALEKTLQDVQELIRQTKADVKSYTPTYRLAVAQAKDAAYTEGRIVSIPAFQNKIVEDIRDPVTGRLIMTGREVADEIVKKLGPVEVDRALAQVAEWSRFSRTAIASLDASAALIQGMPVLGSDIANWAAGRPSNAWVKGVYGMTRAMMNPKNLEQFLVDNAEFFIRHPDLAVGMSEFYAGLGDMSRIAGKIPGIGGLIKRAHRETYGRTGAGFSAFGIYARKALGESFEIMYSKKLGVDIADLPASAMREIDELANQLSGIVSPKVLGVSGKRQAIEQSLIFAPSYTRANLMMYRDLFRGNVRAREVQKAMASMFGGMLFAYVGICKAIGQQPYLNPAPPRYGGDGGKFLGFDVGGSVWGLPGFAYGVLRLLGGLAGAVATNNADTLVSLNVRENPILFSIISRASPVVALSREIATQQSFFGERLDKPSDWVGVLASKITPIMLQSILLQEPRGEFKALFGEFFGMRTWPRGEWEKRDDLRARYLEGTGKNWDDLTRGERDDLERKHTDLAEITDKIRADFALERGTDLDKALHMVRADRETKFRAAMTLIATAYQHGTIDMRRYNDMRSRYLTEKASASATAHAIRAILDKGSAAEYEEWIKKNQKPEDRAMDEYKKIFREPILDAAGLIDWSATFAVAEKHLAGLDAHTRDYIRQYEHAWIQDLDPVARQMEEYRQGLINILREYWGVKDKVMATLPTETRKTLAEFERRARIEGDDWRRHILDRNPRLAHLIRRIDRTIKQHRDILRRNPEVENAVQRWY